MKKIRIGIVDDNPNLVDQLSESLSLFGEVEVVLRAGNGRQLMQKLTTARPDLILMDVEMPEVDGIAATYEVCKEYPEIKVLMLSMFDQEEKVFQAILAGASGYILKAEPVVTILESIENVLAGGGSMSSAIAAKVLTMIRGRSADGKSPQDFGLSEREMQTLSRIAEGKDYLTIASELFISPNTVKKHISHLYDKLHVHSRAEAVRIAMENKWL